MRPAGRVPARATGPAPLAHLLFRLLLFKLYFESGIAKWQSHAARLARRQRDDLLLRDRAAADLAGLVRAPPAGLVAPLREPGDAGAGAGRPVRRSSARARRGCSRRSRFTLFQIVNAATANYGFFCYLALALHVFLLDDRDVERARAAARAAGAALARRLGRSAARRPRSRGRRRRRWPRLARGLAGVGAVRRSCRSLEALAALRPSPAPARCAPLLELDGGLRLVNTYHLFASITRERIEPEFQTSPTGDARSDDGLDAAAPAAQARRRHPRAPTSSRRTSRGSTSSSGSTASRYQRARRST